MGWGEDAETENGVFLERERVCHFSLYLRDSLEQEGKLF